MHKNIILALGLSLGVFLTSSPINQSFAPITVLASETNQIAEIVYDSETSQVMIQPKLGGTTYFSYMVNGEYPAYSHDKVCFFDEDGILIEEKTGMLNQTIFSDDFSDWINVTKTTPKVPQGSEYYNHILAGDCEVVLSYSQVNDTNVFYIPVTDIGTNITIKVVNVAEDGSISEVQSSNFSFSGVSINAPSEMSASLTRVEKDSSSETVKISGDNISYVQLGSEIYYANENMVSIKMTSNGEKVFLVYSKDDMPPKVLTYTVDGLSAYIDEEIVNEVSDSIAPIITTDSLPTEKQSSAFNFKVYTDKLCTISCNGESVEGTELELTITGDGEYLVTASDEAGNYTEKIISVNCFSTGTDGHKLDKENLWGKNVTPSDRLPKTGGISLASVLGIGGISVLSGLFLLKKKK